jgi:hypothetical protein
MPLHYPKPSHNSSAEYQVSGIPYVTASVWNEVTNTTPIRVQFPYVTQWFQVHSWGYGNLKVGFTENGVKATETLNAFSVVSGSLNTGASTAAVTAQMVGPFHLRCKELWIMGTSDNGSDNAAFTVIAGLTNCKSGDFPILTGSDGFEGVG